MLARARRRSPAAAFAAAAVLAALWPAGARASESELDRARSERQALEERLGAITADLDETAEGIDATLAAREALEAEVAQLASAAAQAEAEMTAHAVYAYKNGSNGGLGLVLEAKNPLEALDRVQVIGSLSRGDQETVERATAAQIALRQRRAELADVLAELEAQQGRLNKLREELDAAFGEAKAREGELASREARKRTVSREGQQGTYACPLAHPFSFRDTWGAPRSGGRRHKGVDMFAPMGADVYAMTDSVIVRHSSSRLGGLGMYLAGDDGNFYYYAHLLEILPGYGPGRRVEAGELVARNGDSGNARGGAAHIHMEVRPGGGGNTNPYPFAAAACL